MDKPPPEDFDPYSAECPAREEKQRHQHREKQAHERSDTEPTDCGPEGPCSDFAPELPQTSHDDETSMYQRLMDFGLSLLTPPRDASPKEMRRHAVALSVAVALLYGHIAIACGWLSSIGLSGFASASTVASVQDEVADVRVTLYGVAIRDLYRSMCNARDEQDSLALNDQLQAVKAKYERATGVPYLLPACPSR
jgi:hypothetical protein